MSDAMESQINALVPYGTTIVSVETATPDQLRAVEMFGESLADSSWMVAPAIGLLRAYSETGQLPEAADDETMQQAIRLCYAVGMLTGSMDDPAADVFVKLFNLFNNPHDLRIIKDEDDPQYVGIQCVAYEGGPEDYDSQVKPSGDQINADAETWPIISLPSGQS